MRTQSKVSIGVPASGSPTVRYTKEASTERARSRRALSDGMAQPFVTFSPPESEQGVSIEGASTLDGFINKDELSTTTSVSNNKRIKSYGGPGSLFNKHSAF